MDKYELLNQIGDGTFGSVAKAVSKKTGQLVAVKKMKQKFYTWDECVRLPEVDVVRKIHGHPNIVKLREVIRENNELFFIFEFMDGDLLGAIKKARQARKAEDAALTPAVPIPVLKSYMQQILQALAYLHKRGYFHRDMKPENLLVRREQSGSGEIVKLADFGLVKEIRARPPFTDYVSTRWYRAPELLLQDRAYGAAVDIWAAGCIMAELITTKPLFPGSNEVDQLFRIMSTLGSPTEKTWPGGIQLGKKIRYTFPSIQGCGLSSIMPKHLPAQALELLSQMLTYDPKARPTAEQCLQHPFFCVGIDENNGPSTTALEQLAAASKRLQQQLPSPQSAPAAFGGQNDKTGGGGGGVSTGVHGGTAKDNKAKRRSEGSASPSAVSAQKYYILEPNGKSAASASSPPPPPLEPKTAFAMSSSPKAVGPPERKDSALVSHSPVPSGSPPGPQGAPKGLKGLQIANLRSNALRNLTAAAATSSGVGSPRTNPTAKEKVSYAHALASGASDGRRQSQKESLGASHEKSVGRTTPSSSVALAVGSEKPKGGAKSASIDLDGLMAEFATEISSLGLSAQKRAPDGAIERVAGASDAARKSSVPMAKQDPVTTLLSNSRYKANAPIGTQGPSGHASASPVAGQRSDSIGYRSHLNNNTNSHGLASAQKGVVVDGKRGYNAPKANAGASPSASPHTVTPSIKALLAKHRKGAYSVLNAK